MGREVLQCSLNGVWKCITREVVNGPSRSLKMNKYNADGDDEWWRWRWCTILWTEIFWSGEEMFSAGFGGGPIGGSRGEMLHLIKNISSLLHLNTSLDECRRRGNLFRINCTQMAVCWGMNPQKDLAQIEYIVEADWRPAQRLRNPLDIARTNAHTCNFLFAVGRCCFLVKSISNCCLEWHSLSTRITWVIIVARND